MFDFLINKQTDIISRPMPLAEKQVLEIYKIKIGLQKKFAQTEWITIRGKCGDVSRIFGVSARTIRDIWSRRTWASVTDQLWSQENMHGARKNMNKTPKTVID